MGCSEGLSELVTIPTILKVQLGFPSRAVNGELTLTWSPTFQPNRFATVSSTMSPVRVLVSRLSSAAEVLNSSRTEKNRAGDVARTNKDWVGSRYWAGSIPSQV